MNIIFRYMIVMIYIYIQLDYTNGKLCVAYMDVYMNVCTYMHIAHTLNMYIHSP